MIKRIVLLIFSAAVCLALCACSKNTADPSGAASPTDGESQGKTPAAVLHLVINPEFDIHMASDGTVLAVDCLNKDAEAVYGSFSGEGKPCGEVLEAIIGEAVQQGFLHDKGTVSVSLSVDSSAADKAELLNQLVVDSASEAFGKSGINAGIDFNSDIASAPAPTPPGETRSSSGGVEIDSNGNKVIRNADGTVTVIEDLGDGTMETLLDRNGNRVRTVLADNHGNTIEQTFSESGALLTETTTTADGATVSRSYDESGNLISESKTEAEGAADQNLRPEYAGQTITETDENGDTWHITYDSEGREVSAYRDYTDSLGFSWRDIRQYRPDGSAYALQHHFINGRWEPREMYHSNGVLAKSVGVSGHGLTITYYSDSGSPTEVFSVDNYGCPTHIVYGGDGSYTVYTTEKDGSTSVCYFDASGNEIHPDENN